MSFYSDSEAEKTILRLNGREFEGAALVAQPARGDSYHFYQRDDKDFIRGRYEALVEALHGSCPIQVHELAALEEAHRTVYVGNLRENIDTPDVLERAFQRYGTITDIKIVRGSDLNTGRPRGYAFVVFSNVSSALWVLHEMQRNYRDRQHCEGREGCSRYVVQPAK